HPLIVHPDLHSFPTRRSSDLLLVAMVPEAHAELRVFVTNEKSDDVTVIQADTGTVLKTLAVGQRPRGVTASADGKRVYVANSNRDRKSTRLNSSHLVISYAVF